MEFREFVTKCRQAQKTGVVAEVVTRSEIPARVAQAEREHNRALLFSRIVDRKASVVGNLFGSAARICEALSVRNYPQLFTSLERAIDNPVPIRRGSVSGNDYVVATDPDLGQLLPAMRYSQADAAPYLTSGIIVARYPQSDRRHICFVRMAVLGGNRLLINPSSPHIRQIVDESLGRDAPLEVTILIGPPVELILMACVTMPGEQDKLEVAQAMAGERLIFSEDALPVPWTTEYFLKGRVLPQYAREGPFGEVGGFYSIKERNPICQIDALWQRRNPVFHSVSAGMSREHLELVSLGPRSFLERLKRAVPQIRRYEMPAFGADRLAVIVVTQGYNPRELVESLWRIPIVRGFLFVNEDVASRSAPDLLWALLHRANNSDHFAFSEQRHSVYNTDKFFIDATATDLNAWENRRVEVFRDTNPVAQ